MPNPTSVNIRKTIVIILAGLLIVYHLMKLSQMYLGSEGESHSMLVHGQSLLRIAIAVSLTLTILRLKYSLIAMWVSITALVLSQMVAHLQSNTLEPASLLSSLGYLKGFIVPSLITLLSPHASTDP